MCRWRPRIPGVRALAVAVVLCFALLYLPLLGGDRLVTRLAANENGVVQNVGAAALLGAAIMFGVAYARARRRPQARPQRHAYLLLALAFFFGAGEEASWGQFALDFEPPPAIADANAQDEFNVHTLEPIQDARHAVGFDLVFAGFIAFAVAFAVAVPILAARSEVAHRALTRRLPIVPAVFGSLLVVNLALFASAGILSGADRAHAVTEIAEAGFSVLFFAIAADAARALAPAPRASDRREPEALAHDRFEPEAGSPDRPAPVPTSAP